LVRRGREDRALGVGRPRGARGPGAGVRRAGAIRPVGRARPGGSAAAGDSRRPAMTGPAGPPPERPATLVVIDMQRAFGESDSPWFTPRFAEVVGPIQRLVAAYRPHIVFTRFVAPAVPAGAGGPPHAAWAVPRPPPAPRI